MPYFSQDFINRVIDQTDIVKIVSRYTNLTQKGGRFWGLCPFPDHNEKTASFSVKPEGFYYCFGCEKGGNAVSFVMEMNHMTFPEAVEFLADEAGIPVEYDTSAGQTSVRPSNKKTIYEINRQTANWFFTNLVKEPSAMKYLSDRGISQNAVKTFGLGYSPARGGLYRYLTGKGFKKEDIIEASLARENDSGVYDYFRGRIMFPILDVNDNIVGFGGRVTDGGEPKYLNSPENSVFLKRSMLYNLNRAKSALKESPMLIVEGYMDVISLYDRGIRSVCATLGTALGEKHASIIKRYTENVILCYDGDSPGINAAIRGSGILENAGLNVKVLILPDGHDPDSFVRKYGAKAFAEAAGKAMLAMDFKLEELRSRFDMNDINDRARFLSEASGTVAEVRDEVKWDHYAQKLSGWTGTDIAAVRNIIYSKGGKKGADPAAAVTAVRDSAPAENSKNARAMDMLRYIIASRDNYDRYVAAGGGNFFTGELGELYAAIEKMYESSDRIDIEKNLLYNSSLVRSAALLSTADSAVTDEDVPRYVNALTADMNSERLRVIKRLIEDDSCTDDKSLLIREQSYLKQKLIELKTEV